MRRSPLVVLLSFVLVLASAFSWAQVATPSANAPNTQQSPPPKQGRILTWIPPDHTYPPFGSQIRKAVLEIREQCKDKDGNVGTYAGTGFIMTYHDPRLNADQNFDYLVTNRHVAECLDDDLQPMQVLSISFEVFNRKNGETPTLTVNDHGNANWFFPDDLSVDLAVIPVQFTPDIEPTVLPMEAIFSKSDFEAQNIGEGAKIVLSGYFVQLEGSSKLEPLVREGVLSAIPEAKLLTTLRKPGTIYLGEVHIFGGNSGSPVFISTYGIRPNGPVLDDEFRFLGVVSGFYYEDSDLKLEIAKTVTGKQRANSGISMIVPADFVKDLILNGKDVVAGRDSYFKMMQAVQAKK
jgi:hypothetical protein